MNIFEKLKSGCPVNILEDEEYGSLCQPESARSRQLCWKINTSVPTDSQTYELINELFPNETEENYMMHCPECDHKMIVKK